MNSFFLSIFILYNLSLFPQQKINYLAIREDHCSNTDTNSINSSLNTILKLDTNQISKGLSEYYYDLGMIYFTKFFIYKEKEFIQDAISNFENCVYYNKKQWAVYYNLTTIFYFENQLELAKKNLNKYKKYCKKEEWDNKLINLIEKTPKN